MIEHTFGFRQHLERRLQVELHRLWHEVGRPDTDHWQAWPKALAAVVFDRAPANNT